MLENTNSMHSIICKIRLFSVSHTLLQFPRNEIHILLELCVSIMSSSLKPRSIDESEQSATKLASAVV